MANNSLKCVPFIVAGIALYLIITKLPEGEWKLPCQTVYIGLLVVAGLLFINREKVKEKMTSLKVAFSKGSEPVQEPEYFESDKESIENKHYVSTEDNNYVKLKYEIPDDNDDDEDDESANDLIPKEGMNSTEVWGGTQNLTGKENTWGDTVANEFKGRNFAIQDYPTTIHQKSKNIDLRMQIPPQKKSECSTPWSFSTRPDSIFDKKGFEISSGECDDGIEQIDYPGLGCSLKPDS